MQRHMKRRGLGLVLAVAACLLAGPFVAGAAAKDGGDYGRRVPVAWTRSPNPGGPRMILDGICNPEDQNQCLVPAQTSGLLAGDLQGTAFTLTALGGVPGSTGAS